MITRMMLVLCLFLSLINSSFGHIYWEDSANTPTTETKQSIFDYLSQQEVVEITIETDLTALIENRNRDDYQPGRISVEFEDEKLNFAQDFKLKPRGKFRRRVCDFPPVKLNFGKSELESLGLVKSFDKMKLVTHCISDKFDSKANVVKEYLAYKMYNELTDKSLRVQLVKVTYIDTEGNVGKIKRYGFIIEDIDELAARSNATELEQLNIHPSKVDQERESCMATFQYMIGNEDWSATMLRNVKLIQPNDGAPVIPVPYDFDFSGFVNPPYAIPNSDLGLKSIKERVYIGFPIEDQPLNEMIDKYRANRETLYEVISSCKLIGRSVRSEAIKYLDSFYEGLDNIPVNHNWDSLYGYLKNTPGYTDEKNAVSTK